MDIANLFKQLHGILDASTLIPMQSRPDLVSKEDFNKAVEYLEVDPKNIFYDPNNMVNWCVYYDGLVYFSLHNMKMDILTMFRTKEMLEQSLGQINDLLKKKNYEFLFHIIDKKILIPAFIKYHKEIPKHQLYDIFIDLYQRTEYGFDKIPKDIVKLAIDSRELSNDWKLRMQQLIKKTKGKEFVKIYRGETPKSTPNNMSWTLKKSVAEMFANRFNSQGKVLTKIVKVTELLDYLTSRSEDEVFYLTVPL